MASVPITVVVTDKLGAKATASTVVQTTASNVPVITSTTFSLASNPPLDTLIGTVPVTNLPLTAMNIVSGDPNKYFAIYAATQHLRTSETVTPIPDGSYTLSMTATNSNGTSAPMPVMVTIPTVMPPSPPPPTPPPSGPFAPFDGTIGASTGTNVLAGLLTPYGTNRPPWNVPGVDYPVGQAGGITILGTRTTNPTQTQLNMASTGATISGSTVTLAGANPSLGSTTIGFTFATNTKILIDSTATGTVTIRNCSVKMNVGNQIPIDAGVTANYNLTVLNCEIDGSQTNDTVSQDFDTGLSYSGNGALTVHYCYFHDLPIDGIQTATGTQTIDIRWNATKGIGYSVGGTTGGHPDMLQLLAGTVTSLVYAFNLCYNPIGAETDPGAVNPLLDVEAQLGGILSNLIYANNTLISKGSQSVPTCALICGSFVDDTTSRLNNYSFTDNYVDPTGVMFYPPWWGTASQQAVTTGSFNEWHGNKLLTTGADSNTTSVGYVPAGSTTVTPGSPLTNHIASVAASPSSGNVSPSSIITFTITATRTLTVSPTSFLLLSNSANAAYSSGSGTKTLVYRYTVANGQATNNLAIVSFNGTVTDQFGNAGLMAGVAVTFTGLNVINTVSGTVPMPSLTSGTGFAKRPTYDSVSNTLSWEGPSGGGPSNGVYVSQSRTLTAASNVSSTGPNTVIEGLKITGAPCVTISHNNVTLRQCFVQITPAETASYCVAILTGVTGTIIEDCFFDGNSDAQEGNCIGGGNLPDLTPPTVNGCTVRRNQFFQAGQAIRYILNNISFTENFCHKVAGGDADWFECYPVGGTNNHLLVQYNYFSGPDNAQAGADSGVNLSTGAGLAGGTIGPDVVIDSNWFVWAVAPQNVAWQSHSIANGVGGAIGGNQEVLEFTCTNNGIFNFNPNGYGAGNSTLLGTPSSGSPTSGGGLIHDSGNYVMATPTDRTGTPYIGVNGSGRL